MIADRRFTDRVTIIVQVLALAVVDYVWGGDVSTHVLIGGMAYWIGRAAWAGKL